VNPNRQSFVDERFPQWCQVRPVEVLAVDVRPDLDASHPGMRADARQLPEGRIEVLQWQGQEDVKPVGIEVGQIDVGIVLDPRHVGTGLRWDVVMVLPGLDRQNLDIDPLAIHRRQSLVDVEHFRRDGGQRPVRITQVMALFQLHQFMSKVGMDAVHLRQGFEADDVGMHVYGEHFAFLDRSAWPTTDTISRPTALPSSLAYRSVCHHRLPAPGGPALARSGCLSPV
jgi:hypothetical protein